MNDTRDPRLFAGLSRGVAMIAASSLAALAGTLAVDQRVFIGLWVFGGALFLLGLYVFVCTVYKSRHRQGLIATVRNIIDNDMVPSYLAEPEGRLIALNGAAILRGGDGAPSLISDAFDDVFANPDAILFRLQSRAMTVGDAQETISTRRSNVRLSATRIGQSHVLWRYVDLGDHVEKRQQDSLSLPMLTVGPTGTILFMNDAFRKLTGGRVRSLDKVFHDLPLVSGQAHMVETVAGPHESIVAVAKVNGGRQEVFLVPGEIGAGGRVVSANWDAIEELPVPLLKLSPSGEVLASNDEARALLASSIEPGVRLSELLEGIGRPLDGWLREVAEGRGAKSAQFLQGRGDKQDFFVRVSLCASGSKDGHDLIAVLSDMTEFKSLEAQFVQSQKMQAIGQLAGGVAHDFNNLLTAISGHCDLLLLRHDQGDQDYADLVQIHQNANRAASLVGQLLAYSRKQNLRPEVIDLRDTLADLTHLLNRLVGEKVKLTLSHDPALDPIRVDKRQLEQVIMNLVVNARDAMPSGGEIRIETENILLKAPIERDRASIPAGRYVLVKVVDEGQGISPEMINKIFEPFFTTKRTGEGTGLGLSTVYGIVKQTGGFVFAESEIGIGSVFTLYLPSHDLVAPQTTAESVSTASNVVSPLPRLRQEPGTGVVLLVEDEAPVRAFASRALRLRGYTVLEADCAETALKILEDKALNVDLFVTDVIMPGLDGPTWVREALLERPETRVVFVSGYAEDAFDTNDGVIPNSVFLPKPFSLTDLTQTVQQQLH